MTHSIIIGWLAEGGVVVNGAAHWGLPLVLDAGRQRAGEKSF
jgi:hypothetical protein